MTSGFDNFASLYNNKATNPIQWDINQLKNEQHVLQPIHENYLKNEFLFRGVLDRAKGIDLLDYGSRIRYGCKILGYTEFQGCAP